VATDELTVEAVPFGSTAAQAMVLSAADELDQRYGPEDHPSILDASEFDPPRGAFVIARSGGHLAGGVGLRTAAEGVGEIKRLWVRPDLRRQGIASVLMDAIELEGRARSFAMLVLETGPLQPEAVGLYEAVGWRRVDALPVGGSSYPDTVSFIKEFA
jgi:GNAT superfamily N-acetyltransferase